MKRRCAELSPLTSEACRGPHLSSTEGCVSLRSCLNCSLMAAMLHAMALSWPTERTTLLGIKHSAHVNILVIGRISVYYSRNISQSELLVKMELIQGTLKNWLDVGLIIYCTIMKMFLCVLSVNRLKKTCCEWLFVTGLAENTWPTHISALCPYFFN